MKHGLKLPQVIFGTSSLGNLFTAISDEVKQSIVEQCLLHSPRPVVFDSAGKYGAGLALESLGKALKNLQVDPADVIISNKLGWVRMPLLTPEPTFEPGVWRDLKYDAVQKISYDGILDCFEEGNQLLGDYVPQMVSVHDPDEYLDKATNAEEEHHLYQDILGAYRALADLKAAGKVTAIGVGAKNWKSVQKIAADVDFDWVMIANSMTIKSHPPDLLRFMEQLAAKDVTIINSAVFHSGFLIGGDYLDYHFIDPKEQSNEPLFKWRSDFFAACSKHNIKPAEACLQFAIKMPGVESVALSTTNPERVKRNIDMVYKEISQDFWDDLYECGLIKVKP